MPETRDHRAHLGAVTIACVIGGVHDLKGSVSSSSMPLLSFCSTCTPMVLSALGWARLPVSAPTQHCNPDRLHAPAVDGR